MGSVEGGGGLDAGEFYHGCDLSCTIALVACCRWIYYYFFCEREDTKNQDVVMWM